MCKSSNKKIGYRELQIGMKYSAPDVDCVLESRAIGERMVEILFKGMGNLRRREVTRHTSTVWEFRSKVTMGKELSLLYSTC